MTRPPLSMLGFAAGAVLCFAAALLLFIRKQPGDGFAMTVFGLLCFAAASDR